MVRRFVVAVRDERDCSEDSSELAEESSEDFELSEMLSLPLPVVLAESSPDPLSDSSLESS